MFAERERIGGDKASSPSTDKCAGISDLPLRWAVLIAVLITTVTAAAYINTFENPFILDDERSIVANEGIRHLWPIWDVLAMQPRTRPVVNLSLAVNYAISGLEVGSYHAVNLLVHVLAGIVMFGIVRRSLLREPLAERFGRVAAPLAIAVALIWAVHPLQTSAVTYIIQRAESMMGLFYLLTLYCAIRSLDSARPGRWYVAAAIFCALGMGCKQVMVTAPLMVLLYDRTFAAGSFKRALRRRWPLYLGLAATWMVLFPSFFLMTGHKSAGFGMRATAWQYGGTQFGVIVHYLDLACWPASLCLDYTWGLARTIREILQPAIVIVALVALTIWAVRRRSAAGYAGAWFFVILAPTSSILPIADSAFEHRMYLSLAGLVALVVIGGYLLGRSVLRKYVQAAQKRRLLGGALSLVAVAVVVTAAGAKTFLRNQDYSSKERMWTDVIRKRPNNFRALHNLGSYWSLQGDYDKAAELYRDSLKIWPDYAEAHYHLAEILRYQGDVDEALRYYEQAADNRENLQSDADFASICGHIGRILIGKGRYREAISYYKRSLEVVPNDATAYSNLGIIYCRLGAADQAIRYCQEAVRLDPNLPQAHYGLGVALALTGRTTDGINHFQQAIRLKGDYTEAYLDLGSTLVRLGQTETAIIAFQQVIRLQPDKAEAYYRLGLLFFSTRKFADAAAHFRRALRITPELLAAKNSLAWVLATCPDAALRDGAQAVALSEQVCEADGYKRAELIDTLAAACAEAGLFDKAVSQAKRALELASSSGNEQFVRDIQARLKLYEAGKAYHEGE